MAFGWQPSHTSPVLWSTSMLSQSDPTATDWLETLHTVNKSPVCLHIVSEVTRSFTTLGVPLLDTADIDFFFHSSAMHDGI